ncbi:MAG: hypothetical protein JW923_05365 [Spirochaetales bacterium]|nr:hypothetical protein [Spirochaetales bacterium]
MAPKAPIFPLKLILSQIKDMQVFLFRKTDLTAFFNQQAEAKTEAELSILFDDLFAFNAYLGRLEGYPSFEAIPFWEYSTCLEWVESHFLGGDSFDLNLKNARRFLGNVHTYYEHLISLSKMKDIANLDKAIKEICGGKKLKLVTDIPFTGTETYTAIYQGGKEVRFDVADYWVLILHSTLFDDNWTKLLEAAFGVSGERIQKVKELQSKMEGLGKSKLWDIAYHDVTKAEADRAEAWFFDKDK